ncbi:MAG TPA: 3-phosphoshikimate 1-carboxyvinyltransferase [Spirochaetaceae bacterium]|nr:3-phosphoshikimate 1-carboxyvinyltransferase [Spirochaetaceae bacterium]
MNTNISKGTVSGRIVAPPSKSYAHRLLIASFLASLARTGSGGACRVSGIAISDDIAATLDCLRRLGARFSIRGGAVLFEPLESLQASESELVLDCRESGSTLRFLIPVALELNHARRVTMRGTLKLMSRGLDAYEMVFERNAVSFSHESESFSFCGRLTESEFVVPGNASSQYVTGLLFALSIREGDSKIILDGDVESLPYISMTIDVLSMFGINVVFSGEEIRIRGGQKYRSGIRMVEGDYSNAAFFEAFNYIGGANRVIVDGLKADSLQGDKAYEKLFPLLAGNEMPTICISDCIDLGPVLFMLAAANNGAVFTGVGRLRMKESDRIACMSAELRKFGAEIDESDDVVFVRNAALHAPAVPLDGHNDHRIVMALAVLLTKFGGVIEGSEAVGKSFPDFFEKLGEIGIRCEHFQG